MQLLLPERPADGAEAEREASSFEKREGGRTMSRNRLVDVVRGCPEESSVSSINCCGMSRWPRQQKYANHTWYTISKLSLSVAVLTVPK